MGFFDVSKRYAGLDAKASPAGEAERDSALGRVPAPAGGGLAPVIGGAEVKAGVRCAAAYLTLISKS